MKWGNAWSLHICFSKVHWISGCLCSRVSDLYITLFFWVDLEQKPICVSYTEIYIETILCHHNILNWANLRENDWYKYSRDKDTCSHFKLVLWIFIRLPKKLQTGTFILWNKLIILMQFATCMLATYIFVCMTW